jgi:hypothetical protein
MQPISARQSKGSVVADQFGMTMKTGAAYVTRTRDPIITNDVLYRLS